MLTVFVSGLVIIVFAAWTALTVLTHIRATRKWRWVAKTNNYDLCAMIPIWTFFAPQPGRTDVYLLYRDRDQDGQTTAWRDIQLERRAAWWSLWNARRRIGKGVVDVAPDLTANTSYESRAPVSKKKVLEFSYLLLLNYVCHQPSDFRAAMRQFAVARTRGHGTESEPDVLFLSAFHRLH
jgi:hypothetical protein